MTTRAWFRELRRRWPLLVAVLRGKTVVYNAHIMNGVVRLKHGGKIYDSSFTNTSISVPAPAHLTAGDTI